MSEANRAKAENETPLRCYVGLGANLPHQGVAGVPLLEAALTEMASAGLCVMRASGAWLSPPWPASDAMAGQPDYVNAIAELDVAQTSPRALLDALLGIERGFGRERRERWAARTLDLDIIDFAGLAIDEDGLTLPHPRAHERAFVLAPLAELAPGWRHPILGESAAALLARTGDQGVRRLAGSRFRDCEGREGRIS